MDIAFPVSKVQQRSLGSLPRVFATTSLSDCMKFNGNWFSDRLVVTVMKGILLIAKKSDFRAHWTNDLKERIDANIR